MCCKNFPLEINCLSWKLMLLWTIMAYIIATRYFKPTNSGATQQNYSAFCDKSAIFGIHIDKEVVKNSE